MSSLTDFKVDFDKYGRVSIKMDGNEVLHNEKGIVSKMTANGDEIKLDNDVISITSGKIKGNIEALDDIEESKKKFR